MAQVLLHYLLPSKSLSLKIHLLLELVYMLLLNATYHQIKNVLILVGILDHLDLNAAFFAAIQNLAIAF